MAKTHRFIVDITVDSDDTLDKAESVIRERLDYSEEYGFPYKIEWQHVHASHLKGDE